MRSKSIIELASRDQPGYSSLAVAQRILIFECGWNLLSAKLVVAQMAAEATSKYATEAIMWLDAGIDAIHYIVQILDRAKAQPDYWSKNHDR